MIRTLLTTTAISLLLSAGVIAQDAAPAAPAATEAPAAPDAMAPAADAIAPAADAAGAATDAAVGAAPDAGAAAAGAADAAGDAATDAATTAGDAMGMGPKSFDISAGYTAADTDNLGTRLIGQPVYSSTGEDAEDIGDISDLVFDDNGQITAVIIGVGGFLGIGEKSVAVDFGSLDFTIAADNTERWVLPTTKDALTSAPDFVWQEDEPADANGAATDAAAPAATDTAPAADAMAPAAPATN